MAQLPPKVPSITPTHQPAAPWASEFLGFSAARRGAHRRSVSDSVTFLEECVGGGGDGLGGGFDKDDDDDVDDQLMALFADEPLERSGVNGMLGEEAEPTAGAPPQEETTATAEKIADPRRVKR